MGGGTRLRIGPVHVPTQYTLPSRPSDPAPEAQDAYRQTRFLLADDLALVEQGMGLWLCMAAALGRARTPEAVALLALGSRAFVCLDGAVRLLLVGRYAACPPLVRTACDLVAAQKGLWDSGFQEWREWMAAYPRMEREHAALEVGLGRYRSSAAIAGDPRLSQVYRGAQELSQPHLGASALQAGPELAPDHLPIAFAEARFHLGWAQVVCGWLLVLLAVQLELLGAALPGAETEEAAALSAAVAKALADPQRCRLEEVDGRLLLVNFRRSPGAPPRRLLL